MTGSNFVLFFLEMTQGPKREQKKNRVWEGMPRFPAASSVILCQAGGLVP